MKEINDEKSEISVESISRNFSSKLNREKNPSQNAKWWLIETESIWLDIWKWKMKSIIAMEEWDAVSKSLEYFSVDFIRHVSYEKKEFKEEGKKWVWLIEMWYREKERDGNN